MSRRVVLLLLLLSVLAATPSAPVQSRARYRLAVQATARDSGQVRDSLVRAGLAATLISDAEIANPRRLAAGAFDAIVFPDATLCPIAAKENLLRFLRGGGDMVVVGGPMFEASIARAKQAREARLATLQAENIVMEAWQTDHYAWRHSSSSSAPTTWAVERAGPSQAPYALHVTIADLTGWDTLQTPIAGRFEADDDLTLLWVKGGPRTTAMTVELQEKDGSRWIAPVPLTPHWRRVALSPADFRYWPDNPSKGRGGPSDRVHFADAATLTVGIAQSHVNVPAGRHEFWVAGIYAGVLPPDLRAADLTPPDIELFSPFYKYYHLPSLHPTAAQLRAEAELGNQTGPIVTPIPRPRGLGFATARRGRWIPIASITDDTGRVAGTRESLWVNLEPPYRGSVWAQVASGSVVPAVRRMAAGLFLARGGADQFSYFEDEAIPLGIEVANLTPAGRRAQIRLSIVRGDTGAQGVARDRVVLPEQTLTVSIDGNASRITTLQPIRLPAAPGGYEVRTELLADGAVVDDIVQPISVLATSRLRPDDFVRVRGGEFIAPSPPSGTGKSVPADGGGQVARRADKQPRISADRADRPWYPYGVNYWQSNVAGADVQEYRLSWLAPSYYDPQIVERDLATLQSLGLTSVSIQLGDPEQVRQANDFIWRAARHGMRTNLFISGAHPFDTHEALFTRLITEGRFASNPNIWAYDIAWEHHLGNHDERTAWDRDWENWIVEQYGTLAYAERSWGYPAPRDAQGRITNPPDEQLRRDGPWLKMENAYCRCADDVIARRYSAVIRKIKALDPHHLVSARSASQPGWSGWFSYDLVSSGKPFDFSSPEGYSDKPSEGGFTVAYGRWAGNGKPVFWAEFGKSIYPYDTTGAAAADQAALHRGFAQMLLESGASGLASWWIVGGFRVDERSDFGIIAPDGTPREAARALQAMAAAATRPHAVPPTTRWVTIDRDLHAAGYDAIYSAHKQTYVDAVKEGGTVGVRTPGTGTTSANVPLTCVGNLPYDGFSPLKFMNAEFYTVEVRDSDGRWIDVPDGGTVQVAPGRPVVAHVVAGNLGEARWLTVAPTGAVSLIGDDRSYARSTKRPMLTFAQALRHDVDRYDDVDFGEVTLSPGIRRDSEVVLTFEATGRARFGQRRHILLNVAR